MKAMVLAAGLGTRLRPLTNDRPKALVEIAGRTLLEITLARLRAFGIREVIVNVHHFADQVVEYLKANANFGMRIEISREDVLLDTGGGLKKAAWFFLEDSSSAREPFLLHNVDVISTIDGIALFTNADRGHDDDLIDDLSEIVSLLGDDGSDSAETSVGGDSARSTSLSVSDGMPFNPEDMPEEAQVVEFLQCINRRPLLARRRRIAVIVSAWDVVENGGQSPDQWFYDNRPMLSQYLKFNSDLWDLRIYGVSAQGGNLPRDKVALQEIIKPTHRIKIEGHHARPHDLSAPIGWLMTA